jgi:alpha-glucoside transport system permease protein
MISTAFIAARKTPWEVIFPNLILLIVSLAAFAAIVYLVFLLASRVNVKVQEWLKYAVFLAPAVLLLLIGLVYPTLRTLVMSFMNADSTEFVGFDNYVWSFTIPEILIVLRNTAIWVLVVPILSTLLGLAIAYMTDRMKRPGIVKSLIFLPMAISFVTSTSSAALRAACSSPAVRATSSPWMMAGRWNAPFGGSSRRW